MARSSSSVRRVLRKLTATSARADFLSTCCLSRNSLLGQQRFTDTVPVSLLPSNRVSADSQGLHSLQRWNGGEVYSPELRTSSGTAKSDETLQLRNFEQRWARHHIRRSNSSFVLHPFVLVGSRGFASSGSSSNDGTTTPTTPSDGGSTEGAENAARGVKEWAKCTYNGIVDWAKATGDALDVATPPMKKFLEEHPIILEVSLPVTIFTGAWVILPRVLRQMHVYVEMGSAVLLQGQERQHSVPYELSIPYELSVWKAMEDPARLFATLLTSLQVGMIIAPSAVVAQYLTQFWSGGSVLCVVWFLHRWKRNVFTRLLAGRQVTKEERERYLGFDKFSSLGLIFVGALGLAEAAGVAVSSLLTVGGIGGIATAFAAREILANLLTGLTLSFSKPFTVGDTIKAGAVEGKVEEVGMISTRLLNLEKNPIIVPNAFFTSQAIVNKSRAPWRFLAVKIPINLTDFERVPVITLEIREMLYRNPQIYLEEDKPQCHIAQFSPSALELAITCNVKPMSKNEYLLVEQGILVEAARIITTAGAKLGGP